MKRTGNILILLLITIIATSCDGGDRDRIPAAAVRVEFANQAMWDQYGVSGSFIHRLSSATGYGGLMLITNEHGVPYVYDLCCPVEINSNIRIEFDENNLCLRCPKCGSTYDITTGGPMTGTAKDGRYFLQSYNIAPYGSAGGQLIYR